LINKDLIKEKTLPLINLGRHFFIKNCWLVVGRNRDENKIIEEFKDSLKSEKSKPAVYYSLKKKIA